MAVKISSGVAAAVAAANSLRGIFHGVSELRVYGGLEPASANAAIGSAVLLFTYRGDGGAPLEFEASAPEGILSKSAGQIWTGNGVADGTATFCRLVLPADTDEASTTAPRVQGDVGLAGKFLTIGNTAILTGAPQRLGSFRLAWPLQ